MNTFVDFASCLGLFIGLGGLLNSLTTRALRHAVASKFFLTPQLGSHLSLSDVAIQFIQNTVVRYFGMRIFSCKAFIRSAVLSVVFFVALSVLAWLNRCRRLAKDFENLSHNALAFLRLASIRLMVRRLCNPS